MANWLEALEICRAIRAGFWYGSRMNNTNPYTPSRITQPIRMVRKRSRRGSLGWLLFGCLMLPVFCCGLSLLTYLIFPPQPLDVLVLGVDGREGEGYVSRTDSVMLIGVVPRQLRVSMLSIPRDLFVDTPGYGRQRVNTVNVLGEQEQLGGGPILVGAAMQQTFGVGVDRYVRLDFDGFVKLVDAVGGITIDVERRIVDTLYPTGDGGVMTVQFETGVQEMDGERALIYARTRQADDDYFRAGRQQQVVSALFAKLVNPLRWPAAWAAVSQAVDTNLSVFDALAIAPPILLNRGRYEQLVINRDYITGTADGHAIPNLELVLPWLQERFH